jgi:hypothetical protein
MDSLEAIRQKEKELEQLKQEAIAALLKERDAIDEKLKILGYEGPKRGRPTKTKGKKTKEAAAG